MADTHEHVVDMVGHCSHSVKPFFCGGGVEFVVVIKLHGAWIKAILNAISGEFVGSGGCGIIGKFCMREPCSAAVLPIVSVDT